MCLAPQVGPAEPRHRHQMVQFHLLVAAHQAMMGCHRVTEVLDAPTDLQLNTQS